MEVPLSKEGSDEHEAVRDGGPSGGVQPGPAFRWDDSKMVTRYANAVQVTGTREEIVLLLGTHQVWQNAGREPQEVVVPLEERVLLGPHAAKRLHAQLTLVLAAFEARYGKLSLPDVSPSQPPSKISTSRS